MARSNRSFLYIFYIEGTLETRDSRSNLSLEFFQPIRLSSVLIILKYLQIKNKASNT